MQSYRMAKYHHERLLAEGERQQLVRKLHPRRSSVLRALVAHLGSALVALGRRLQMPDADTVHRAPPGQGTPDQVR